MTYTYIAHSTLNVFAQPVAIKHLTERVKRAASYHKTITETDVQQLISTIEHCNPYGNCPELDEYNQLLNTKISDGLVLITTNLLIQTNFLTSLLFQMGDHAVTDLAEYLPDELTDLVTSILPLQVTIENDRPSLQWRIQTNRELTDVDQALILDYLNGQLSDGWGENGTEEIEMQIPNYYSTKKLSVAENALQTDNFYDNLPNIEEVLDNYFMLIDDQRSDDDPKLQIVLASQLRRILDQVLSMSAYDQKRLSFRLTFKYDATFEN